MTSQSGIDLGDILGKQFATSFFHTTIRFENDAKKNKYSVCNENVTLKGARTAGEAHELNEVSKPLPFLL